MSSEEQRVLHAACVYVDAIHVALDPPENRLISIGQVLRDARSALVVAVMAMRGEVPIDE